MSPIRADQRALYDPDWANLSLRVRKNRAHDRCECDGRCGREVPQHVPMSDVSADLVDFAMRRCTAAQGEPSQISGKPVVLTVAHLDHDPTNNDRSNLCAMCQACHLAYDAEHHAETRAATRAAANLSGMPDNLTGKEHTMTEPTYTPEHGSVEAQLPGVEYSLDFLAKNGHTVAAGALGLDYFGYDRDFEIDLTADQEALAVQLGHYFSEVVDDNAPLNERQYVDAARGAIAKFVLVAQ